MRSTFSSVSLKFVCFLTFISTIPTVAKRTYYFSSSASRVIQPKQMFYILCVEFSAILNLNIWRCRTAFRKKHLFSQELNAQFSRENKTLETKCGNLLNSQILGSSIQSYYPESTALKVLAILSLKLDVNFQTHINLVNSKYLYNPESTSLTNRLWPRR